VELSDRVWEKRHHFTAAERSVSDAVETILGSSGPHTS